MVRLTIVVLLAGCSGARLPSSGGGDMALIPSNATYKRVFAASVEHDGNFGGPSGGDALCNDAAHAAGLGSAFDAFLGTAAIAAPDRLQGAGPWYLVDGSRVVFADQASIVAAGATAHVSISQTELGTAPPTSVWTGWGAMYSSDCSGWTSAGIEDGGTAGSTSGGWADAGGVPSCYVALSIYCFER